MTNTKLTICLNMIVKNESHIIIKTLNNLSSYISFNYWVICDTGSTDNTKELITNYFKEKNIAGELVEDEWKDFAYNRTRALDCAFDKTDLLFIFDADDEIIGDFVLPTVCTHDRYSLQFGLDFTYTRPLLLNNRKKWCFKGVLHEFLVNLEPVTDTAIKGNYYVQSGRLGDRSKNPLKYINDATILKDAHYAEEKNDYSLSCRYAFYCAQSYKDSGPNYIDDAIEWYKKCLTFRMWNQEKYYSCLKIGELYMIKNEPQNALHYWYKTIEFDPERLEGIIRAIQYLQSKGEHLLVNALYYKFKNYVNNFEGKLFILTSIYNDYLEYYNSISAYYINDKQSGYDCCKKIFLNRILPYHLLKLTISNFQFYINLIHNNIDTNETVLQLFYNFDEMLKMISLKNETIEPGFITIWNKLFNRCRPLLTKPTDFIFSKKLDNPNIIITFTTCKRFDLFKETVYSLLNHWSDINKINYWFCVDDNSSDTDRDKMKTLFPWIDYHMKTIEEKGHRKSMNIIWDKLNELKPTYWIHMEDDWLFYSKQNYIEDAINKLNELNKLQKYGNIKQILFNRNYGETVSCYNILGHQETDDKNTVLHVHKNNLQVSYKNCHYWPNYSFRPSLIDVKTILELGNFHSSNTFFEKDYGHKWTDAGYRSAFFNSITSMHIGRQTGQQHIKNAYELNGETQFSNTNANNPDKNTSIKIINLERREDRKKSIIDKLTVLDMDSSKYDFFKAIDGLSLKPNQEIFNLFKNNDFNYRKGIIGCALSHYNLWKKLINDTKNDYYLILEDDCVFNPYFIKAINLFKENGDFLSKDILFLGYSMYEKNRQDFYNIYNNETTNIQISQLNKNLYIGGTFTYSINKNGARILLDYIEKNGIKHGIDYLIKINTDLVCYECQPQLVFSEWNENGKKIDSDIQNIYDTINFSHDITSEFIFVPNVDQHDCDMYYNNSKNINEYMNIALSDKSCVAFNTLGFFKNKIIKLTKSNYFKDGDGIYIKKDYYNDIYLKNNKTDTNTTLTIEETIEKKDNNKIRIKMLCNWCSSEQLCKEWSNMCLTDFSWKNIEITWKNDNIDYYVIINKPLNDNEYYIPEKTIVFQMEPWVYNKNCDWGVKTWGQWAIPDETKFFKVFGRKTNDYNNVYWQLEKTYTELKTLTYDTKIDKISSICSNKYFDEGHIHRVDFLKFLEDKNDIPIDIFSQNNTHNFKKYKSTLSYLNKSDGYIPYKYYFMVENNYEHNYITEKLWEPILCECLCFYYGCPNVLEHIDENAFVLLDMNDFEKSYSIIKKAIEEDWWSKRIHAIRKQKQKLLNEMMFFPRIEKLFL